MDLSIPKKIALTALSSILLTSCFLYERLCYPEWVKRHCYAKGTEIIFYDKVHNDYDTLKILHHYNNRAMDSKYISEGIGELYSAGASKRLIMNFRLSGKVNCRDLGEKFNYGQVSLHLIWPAEDFEISTKLISRFFSSVPDTSLLWVPGTNMDRYEITSLLDSLVVNNQTYYNVYDRTYFYNHQSIDPIYIRTWFHRDFGLLKLKVNSIKDSVDYEMIQAHYVRAKLP